MFDAAKWTAHAKAPLRNVVRVRPLYSAQVPVRATITPDQISSGKGTVPDLPLGWWYADGHW